MKPAPVAHSVSSQQDARLDRLDQSTGKEAARLPALDWMRGLVMLLMTTDHASGALNAGRLLTDATWLYRPGTPLPAVQFMTRWVSHLCAPTFVFLAGAALALSVERRLLQGESSRNVDRHLLIRGLFLAALDPLWMTWAFVPGDLLLQVMYAIGMSLVCMAFLRRLSTTWLIVLGVGIIFLSEALIGLVTAGGHETPPLLVALLLTGGRFPKSWLGRNFDLLIAYPLLPWLAIMILGWVFGRYLLTVRRSTALWKAERVLCFAGLAALALYFLTRGLNGYGNMGLLREDGSLVQWLHVSKYPPAITFSTLELGLMVLCLYGFFRLSKQANLSRARWNPLLVFGQTALFFYLLHAHLLELGAYALGVSHKLGLTATFAASGIVAALLYPLCLWYRSYKREHPQGWTQYV
jgi:uncharacterized membrane protein